MTTQIHIPGKEVQTIADITMSIDEVKAAYAGTIDLSSYEATSTVTDGVTIIQFKNRTGTKGSDNPQLDALFGLLSQALNAQEGDVIVVEEYEEELESEFEVANTEIRIPGRAVQTLPGMVLDSTQVIATYSGRIDLNAFAVTSTDVGDTRVIEFTQRAGTKG